MQAITWAAAIAAPAFGPLAAGAAAAAGAASVEACTAGRVGLTGALIGCDTAAGICCCICDGASWSSASRSGLVGVVSFDPLRRGFAAGAF